MRFIHQIETEVASEKEKREMLALVRRNRPETHYFINVHLRETANDMSFAVSETEYILKKHGVKRASIYMNPDYKLHAYTDFDVGATFPASIEVLCAGSSCFIDSDIPIKTKEKVKKEDVEVEGMPQGCVVEDIHTHGDEVHVHLFCRYISLRAIPSYVEQLVNIAKAKKVKIKEKVEAMF
jgi:hypothetical protein